MYERGLKCLWLNPLVDIQICIQEFLVRSLRGQGRAGHIGKSTKSFPQSKILLNIDGRHEWQYV